MHDSHDAQIGSLAARQHGLVTTKQALAIGLSATQIHHRAAGGRWERVARGVYRVRGAPVTSLQRPMAAVLARPDGVISFLNAAEVSGFDISGPPLPWLIVPPTSSARSSAAQIHRSDLPPDQVTTFQAIRTTTPARTLVDCSSLLGRTRLAKLVDQAMHRRMATPGQVEAILDANQDRRLVAAHDLLRELIEVWRPTIRPGSPAEARLLRTLGEWGFPAPVRQVRIRDGAGDVIARLDGGWPERRIGLEYDSVEWHGPAQWASDEERHALVEALGWTLIHVDKADITPGATRFRDRLVLAFMADSHGHAPLAGP